MVDEVMVDITETWPHSKLPDFNFPFVQRIRHYKKYASSVSHFGFEDISIYHFLFYFEKQMIEGFNLNLTL